MNYRKHKGLGSTDLKNILISPEYFKMKKDNQILGIDDSSLPMREGTVLHAALLEPETLEQVISVHDYSSKLKKEYQDFKIECFAAGTIPYSRKEYESLATVRDNYNPVRDELFSILPEGDVIIEKGFYSKVGDVPIKAKPDILHVSKDKNYVSIIDVKSVGRFDEISEDSLRRRCFVYNFFLQLFHYKTVISAHYRDAEFSFHIIWVCKEDPFIVKRSEIPLSKIEESSDKFLEGIGIYTGCTEKGSFTSPAEIRLFGESDLSYVSVLEQTF